MTEPMISANSLSKIFRVPVRKTGLAAALSSLGRRSYEEVAAVKDVSFTIDHGEIVGFIGPNGAGKTTTLKMLAGLLHPSSGSAMIAGYVPWERKKAFLKKISMVLGNKSQMLWDIPPLETFRVLAEIYHVPPADYRKTLDELVSLLDMGALLERPVRTFSLGERMKCELVAGLIFRPSVLFLDEPTLGLDTLMQARLREFICDYNRLHGATIILTSHYMADVVALCQRVILIHNGQLLFSGPLARLAEKLAPYKLVRITLSDNDHVVMNLPGTAEQIEKGEGQFTIRVNREEAPGLTSYMLNNYPITDLVVEDPPIEAVIDRIYREEAI